MTTIDFYTHVDAPLEFAARLVAKAWSQHGSVRVLTPDRVTSDRLDRLLWTQSQLSFVPHCRLDSPLAAETPVLVDESPEHAGPAAVLVNLAHEPCNFFSRFERVAEIVGTADDDAIAAARSRFRFYRERGYELRSHNMAETGS
ncbi:MAG: DNA polymerase III subunit chi [Proteobacteria bacterium]|nr:DNA polymerase III subunit chi [Pseudomonadota bacterium]